MPSENHNFHNQLYGNLFNNMPNQMTYMKIIISALVSILFFIGCDNRPSSNLIACGGPMNAVCPMGKFCKLNDNCGDLDRHGICRNVPQNCSLEEDKICGCDNREYLNECRANTLGITMKNPGSCIKNPILEVQNEDD